MSTAYFDAVGRRAGVRCGGVFGRFDRVAARRVPFGQLGASKRDSLVKVTVARGFPRSRVGRRPRSSAGMTCSCPRSQSSLDGGMRAAQPPVWAIPLGLWWTMAGVEGSVTPFQFCKPVASTERSDIQ